MRYSIFIDSDPYRPMTPSSSEYQPQPGDAAPPLASPSALTADDALFVLIALEGPDPYSQAGGLGVRVSELARTLAELGFETHLFFIGDPALPGEESRVDGRLILHRWGQWISAYHPGGVYDGEEGKWRDLTSSLPPYLADRIVRPAVRAGRVPVIISEEWQTAEFACALSDHLHALGIRDRAVLFWNANNPYSFDRIDWTRLAFTNTITAVSRYMRGMLRARGVDAIVIPNGIPARLLRPTSRAAVSAVRTELAGARLLFKMARWEREKGWTQALDAMACLRRRERRAVLVARGGGPAGAGEGLQAAATERGLNVIELGQEPSAALPLGDAVREGADVVSLRFGVGESLARTLYTAADAVVANSVSEPFGLVGLEAMAAGGVVFTGGTGEDYAVAGRNAIVLETLDAEEIADRSDELAGAPSTAARIRRAARLTARRYTWESVAGLLLARVEEQARRQGLTPRAAGARPAMPVPPSDPLGMDEDDDPALVSIGGEVDVDEEAAALPPLASAG